MRALLDTHAIIWWITGNQRLSRVAYATISDSANVLVVSAAAVWEVATKVRLGRLPHLLPISDDLPTWISEQGIESLPVSVDHGHRAGMLPGPHQDPFDRMLIAQAQAEDLSIISVDEVFDRYGVRRIW